MVSSPSSAPIQSSEPSQPSLSSSTSTDAAVEDLAIAMRDGGRGGSGGGGGGEAQEMVVIDQRGEYSAICKLGFLSQNDSILITSDVLILHESEDAGPSILFVYSLCSMPSLKPHISVELSWSLVTEKGVMCGNCFVCCETYERVKKSCLVTGKVTVVWLVEFM